MTATAPGWYDAVRWRELTSVVALIASPHAYRASPAVVDWTPRLPGDCTELTAWAEQALAALGWPPDCLERWICKTEEGRAHAVLIANLRLSNGIAAAVAIDCRRPTPALRLELPYRDWRLLPSPGIPAAPPAA